jgi:hypothetical protein
MRCCGVVASGEQTQRNALLFCLKCLTNAFIPGQLFTGGGTPAAARQLQQRAWHNPWHAAHHSQGPLAVPCAAGPLTQYASSTRQLPLRAHHAHGYHPAANSSNLTVTTRSSTAGLDLEGATDRLRAVELPGWAAALQAPHTARGTLTDAQLQAQMQRQVAQVNLA